MKSCSVINSASSLSSVAFSSATSSWVVVLVAAGAVEVAVAIGSHVGVVVVFPSWVVECHAVENVSEEV